MIRKWLEAKDKKELENWCPSEDEKEPENWVGERLKKKERVKPLQLFNKEWADYMRNTQLAGFIRALEVTGNFTRYVKNLIMWSWCFDDRLHKWKKAVDKKKAPIYCGDVERSLKASVRKVLWQIIVQSGTLQNFGKFPQTEEYWLNEYTCCTDLPRIAETALEAFLKKGTKQDLTPYCGNDPVNNPDPFERHRQGYHMGDMPRGALGEFDDWIKEDPHRWDVNGVAPEVKEPIQEDAPEVVEAKKKAKEEIEKADERRANEREELAELQAERKRRRQESLDREYERQKKILDEEDAKRGRFKGYD